jgi:carbon monoxide dehydrogenase subunit G
MSRTCRQNVTPDERRRAVKTSGCRRRRLGIFPLNAPASRATLKAARTLLAVTLVCANWPAAGSAVEAQAGAEMQGEHVASWGSVDVASTPEIAFGVLTDYDRMTGFMPGMIRSQAVSREGNSVVVDQTADVGGLFFSQRVIARLAVEELPPVRLTLRALSGSFKELTGTYVLTPGRGRTHIEYRSRFVPAFKLPPLVGLYAVKHSLERHLEGIAAEIQRRSSPGAGASSRPAPPSGPGPSRGE